MHQQKRATPADVAQACTAEAEKTTKLLHDLQATIASNLADIDRLTIERSAWQTKLKETGIELKMMLQQRLQVTVQKLRDIQCYSAQLN